MLRVQPRIDGRQFFRFVHSLNVSPRRVLHPTIAAQNIFVSLTPAPQEHSSEISRRSPSKMIRLGLLGARLCSTNSMPIVLPPTKHLAIVTCMDARINVFSQLGVRDGEAHIIRNAGGSARDALRSLVVSQHLLGTNRIAVYHHTGCGIYTFTKESLGKIIREHRLEDFAEPSQWNKFLDDLDFLSLPTLTQEQSVRADVKFLRECPLLVKGTIVEGWVWDVEKEEARQVDCED